ncbi:outer membrane beta-barrel protein [Sphingobacterium sp. 40-24]|uniref:outer membrane beta-barrel protein n=1 Tax=Sphingobacterium sp. 40-24 TaxID=1895843 RepID=UPI000A6B9A8E|nr:outer membrane beta-barrel protein [Sphingobacterium sp. 40-24]
MMNIKKTALLLCLSLGAYTGYAQTKWNVKAGVAFSNVDAKNKAGDKASTAAVAGLYLGLGPTLRLSEYFFLEPALVFAKRGFERNEGNVIGWGKDFKAHTSYIEMPIDVVFNATIGAGKLEVGIGPYIGYGLGGKWKTSGPVHLGDIAIGEEGDIKFTNDASEGGYGSYNLGRPFDYGARAKVNYLFREHYLVGIEFQKGIANLESKWGNYKSGDAIRNRSLGISLGYRF